MKKKKSTLEGLTKFNAGTPNEFTIEYENLPEKEAINAKLAELLTADNLWDLLLEGRKMDLRGVKRFFFVLVLFAFTNIGLFYFSVLRLFAVGFDWGKVPPVLLVAAMGIGVSLYALYRGYQYAVIDAIRVMYINLEPFFRKIAEIVIDQTEEILKGKREVTDKDLAKALDWSKMVNEKFQRLPFFIKRGLIMVLKRIPLVGILVSLSQEVSPEDKAALSNRLFERMDGHIQGSIFGANNTWWIAWLYPLNVLFILLFILFKIG